MSAARRVGDGQAVGAPERAAADAVGEGDRRAAREAARVGREGDRILRGLQRSVESVEEDAVRAYAAHENI